MLVPRDIKSELQFASAFPVFKLKAHIGNTSDSGGEEEGVGNTPCPGGVLRGPRWSWCFSLTTAHPVLGATQKQSELLPRLHSDRRVVKGDDKGGEGRGRGDGSRVSWRRGVKCRDPGEGRGKGWNPEE